jgi:hypothetical protein
MSTNRMPRPEQLSLLRPSELPVQFRLDQRTRERGLAHIAELRQQISAMHTAAAAPSRPTRFVRRVRDEQHAEAA